MKTKMKKIIKNKKKILIYKVLSTKIKVNKKV